MGNVIFAINISVDGCCDHTKSALKPGSDGSNQGMEEILEQYTRQLQEADLLVYGRKTYQLMVPFWPDVAKNPSTPKVAMDFATTFDSIPKLVFSRSLESVGANSRIARTSLPDEIRKLKQEPGKNIWVGGVDLPSQLIKLGLVDEYRVVVMPTIAGEGRRLLDGVSLAESLQLRLVDSKTLKSGCVVLRYVKQ